MNNPQPTADPPWTRWAALRGPPKLSRLALLDPPILCTPAPCPPRPGTPSRRSGVYSQALTRDECRVRWTSRQLKADREPIPDTRRDDLASPHGFLHFISMARRKRHKLNTVCTGGCRPTEPMCDSPIAALEFLCRCNHYSTYELETDRKSVV